jgi:uncharacterized membrane protein YccC
MSIPCKAERAHLNHDELNIVAATHHPAIYEMDAKKLRDLQKQLRGERGKAQTLSRQKHREARGKAEARGKSFPATAEQPLKRKQIFANALKRVNRELVRLQKLEAKTEHVEAAHRALAQLRSAKFVHHPASDKTAGKGMQPVVNVKRRQTLSRSKVGSVLKANNVAQAIRDARPT